MFHPMKLLLAALCITAAVADRSLAQGPALTLQPPNDLTAAQTQFAAATKPLTAQRDEKLATMRKFYADALERMQKEATAKGDLDTALAAKTEREALAVPGELSAESRKKLPAALLASRTKYDQAAMQIEAQARAQEAALIRSYLAMLDALQKRITVKGDLEGAVKVKDERQTVAARLGAIDTGKAPPAIAPLAPLTLTPSLSALSAKVAPVAVAASLQAKGSATTPAANTVVFSGPTGNGRSGAKGILLKSEPGSGSTWTFKYQRGGTAYGVEIIHPLGRGHAIVHLGKGGIGLSTPKAWTEVGYGGGDSKRVNQNKTFDEIFPLKDGQEYEVVSRMSAGGAFELLIDGKSVATGRASGADPLSLEIPEGKTFPLSGRGKLEFKGDDLPLKWSPGWAGILLGPLDDGQHSARELRYTPNAAEGAR